MGWIRRIFGIPDCECSCRSATDHGHATFSSDEQSSSEENESPEEKFPEEDEEDYLQITTSRSPKFQPFSHCGSFGNGYELWPSSFYETDGSSSNCYQDEVWNTERFPVFRDHHIWDSENWGHYFFNQPKNDQEFSTSYNNIFDRQQARPQLRCYVCYEFIPCDEYGRLDYQEHYFWKLKYCRSHHHDGTPRCASCERFKVRDTRYVKLNDGRMICSECLETATMGVKDCHRIYLEVKEYYKSLDMEVKEQIPVHLVDKFEMNKAMNADKVHRCSLTVGLFRWSEPDIRTMIERTRITGDDDTTAEIREEPYKLVSHVKAATMFVLYGYPRIFTKSIIVHELMHAWLTFSGYPGVELEVEEGICQVMSHMWLSSEIKSLPSGRRKEIRLGEFFMDKIENSMLPYYGRGFRKGNKAVMNCGLKWTLDYIRMTGNFPP